jgi:hypothetical protein
MKRVILMLVFVAAVVIMGTGFITGTPTAPVEEPKKSCRGYEVIEANKGIDCNGDTIQLVRRNGFFEIASKETV